MPVAAHKADKLADELFDRALLVSEIRAHAIRAEVDRLWEQEAVDALTYHQLQLGIAWRLEDRASVLRHAEHALAEQRNTRTLGNLGAALIAAGRDPRRAIQVLVDACEESEGRELWVVCNLAEAFSVVGAWPQARETFDHAVATADFADLDHLYVLTECAGSINEYERCVSFLAQLAARSRGVSPPADPLAFLDSLPSEWWSETRLTVGMLGAVSRLRALRSGPVEVPTARMDDEADVVRLLEVTRPARARANRTVLSSG